MKYSLNIWRGKDGVTLKRPFMITGVYLDANRFEAQVYTIRKVDLPENRWRFEKTFVSRKISNPSFEINFNHITIEGISQFKTADGVLIETSQKWELVPELPEEYRKELESTKDATLSSDLEKDVDWGTDSRPNPYGESVK